MILVLDASAMIAFLRDECGAKVVADNPTWRASTRNPVSKQLLKVDFY